MSIGQGYFRTTPLQVACMTASLAAKRTRTEASILHDAKRKGGLEYHGAEELALSDEQERRKQLAGEASGMVTLIKEYIALPESDRISHTQAFCEQAAARLAAVECAMMQE